MGRMVERVARAIARHHYGSDGYREEDDGVQYWAVVHWARPRRARGDVRAD
jgi:hypothetical protein